MAHAVNLEFLNRIMQKMANEGKIFQNEAQFQFDLAWEIRNALSSQGYQILLERWTNSEERKRGKGLYTKKSYTDIVVHHDTEGDIAIELKYKTVILECKQNKLALSNHFAQDLGRYDFLYDVERNEKLVGKEQKAFRFVAGYAILLTNDKSYWNKPAREGNNDKEFRLDLPSYTRVHIDKSDKKWEPGSSAEKTWRGKGIFLNQEYNGKWEDYNTCKNCCTIKDNKEFKYLIFETK